MNNLNECAYKSTDFIHLQRCKISNGTELIKNSTHFDGIFEKMKLQFHHFISFNVLNHNSAAESNNSRVIRVTLQVLGHQDDFFFVLTLFNWTEPIGSVPPRLPPKSKFDTMEQKTGSVASIVCDAQSHPAPSYRYEQRSSSSSATIEIAFNYFIRARCIIYPYVHTLR